jgi:urease accessory protein UreH
MRKEAIDFLTAIGRFAVDELKDVRSEHYILTALTNDSTDPQTMNEVIDKLKSSSEIHEKYIELESRTKLITKLFEATQEQHKALVEAIKKDSHKGL